MTEQVFFTGPAILEFFYAAFVTGIGEVNLDGAVLRHQPNHINRHSFDITPRPGTDMVMAHLDAEDLVFGSDVWIYLYNGAVLFDVKRGHVPGQQFGGDQHLLWLVPGRKILAVRKHSKKKIFGGDKLDSVSIDVAGNNDRLASKTVMVTFSSSSAAGPFADRVLAIGALPRKVEAPGFGEVVEGVSEALF